MVPEMPLRMYVNGISVDKSDTDNSSARRTGKFSDLTVKRGQQSHRVHKVIMCLSSEWFNKACSSDKWKVSNRVQCHLNNPLIRSNLGSQ
jgi:hypothetical protein